MTATGTPTKKLDGRLKALLSIAALSAIVVVVAAFVLSFDALKAVGMGAKMSEGLAPLLPLSVDGAITVGTMSATVLKYMRRSTRYSWIVVMAGIAVSGACNALHAISSKAVVINGVTKHVVTLGSLEAGLIAVIPAVALPVSLHLLLKLGEAVMEALRTDSPDVLAKPRTPSPRKSRTPVAETVRPAIESRTADPYAARTDGPRTDVGARTGIPRTVPAPRTALAAEPVRPAVVTEKIDRTDEETGPTDGVKKVDRDEFVNELAWEIVAAGADWKPDYDELIVRSGYKKSWCEKAVSAARKLAEGGTLTADDRTDGDERTDAEPAAVRAEQ